MKRGSCIGCDYHKIIRDPDPYDWFCGDNVALVCTLTKNPKQNVNSDYFSDWNEFRSVTCSCRPYRITQESKIPDWCPKK